MVKFAVLPLIVLGLAAPALGVADGGWKITHVHDSAALTDKKPAKKA